MSASGVRSGAVFAHVADLAELAPEARRSLVYRDRSSNDVAPVVAEILARVRSDGDTALRELARELDGVALSQLEVDRDAIDAGLASLEAEQRAALEAAAGAIARVHRAQRPRTIETEPWAGVKVSRRPVPLERIGAYAPGGRAAYPSSVLMCTIPARIAGVDEVIVCSPPGDDGLPAATVRAACAIAGVDRLFAVGGAGAIAAMGLGTTSVPRVDKVVGPGNAWVEEAKRQLAGEVAIDCPAGPSELFVLADSSASVKTIVAEALAQAEHDPRAAICIVVEDRELAAAVVQATTRALDGRPEDDVARAALAAQGAVLVSSSLDEGCRFADDYAPEHLLVLTANAGRVARRIRHAGCVFVGPHASVAFGDYTSGGNHVLPTGGRARAWSGLSSLDFIRWVGLQEIDAKGAAGLAAVTATLASMEGLPAHAAAAARLGSPGATPKPARPAARRRLRGRGRYAPGRRDAPVELSDNTNLFGVDPAAAAAIETLEPDLLRRYPTVYGEDLKRAIADELGVDRACVATGCGSDDLLDAAMRAFLEPGATLARCVPTFSMVLPFADTNDIRCLDLPATPELAADVDALGAAGAEMTYLCRPDNPSGALVAAGRVRALADVCDGLLLVDEAYVEFSGEPSLAAWAASRDDVLVLRTFSKVAGLAGLRVGYATGAERLVGALEIVRGPYKVSTVAERVAGAVLAGDRAWRRDTVDRSVRNRDRLRAELDRRGARVWPSAANFLLVAAPDGFETAGALADALRARGVGVRPFDDLPRAGHCVRVSIGPWALMSTFLEAWDDSVQEAVS